MSEGERIPYDIGMKIAEQLCWVLEPYVERVAVMGSLRRQCPDVGDIDLLVIPRPGRDLFEAATWEDQEVTRALRAQGCDFMMDGRRHKRCRLPGYRVPVEIYLCERAQWGVMSLIRTGSGEFSRWFVTSRRYGGGMPSHMKIDEGRVWVGGEVLETPDERAVFTAAFVPWVDPSGRDHAPRTFVKGGGP